MGFARTAVGVLFISVFGFYLSTLGQLTDEAKWAFVAAMALLAVLWINLGGKKKPRRKSRPSRARAATTPEIENAVETEAEGDEEEEDDIPEPVRSTPADGASLRERKLAKIAAAEATKMAEDSDEEEQEVVIEVELEEVHIADEYVVDVSPESVEDADIEITVRDRRVRHEAIRERIKRRRMGQMADIRASTARMWEDYASGEDLVALLQTQGHGHTVLVEPENPAPGHVYGATFVRIDEGRILKLRLPLDTGFESIGSGQPEPAAPPVLLGPDGKALPPLIGPDGTPLALPPLPSSSTALDAMREEMKE